MPVSASLRASSGHGGGPFAFHPHPVAWALVVVLATAYALALGRRPSPGRPRPTPRQWWCLAGGLLSMAAALTWPLADLAAHWSLSALVLQRLLLTLAAAPLLMLSVPAPVLGHLTRPALVDGALDLLTRPVVAVVSFTVVAVGTLTSPAVAAQASSGTARDAVDALLLLAGVVLWGPVLKNIPGAHRAGSLGTAVYLFVQSIVPTFPAVIFVFARHPLYPAFAHRALDLSALADQQLAGIVAKVGTLPVLWSVAWVALARGHAADREGKDLESLTWADVERQLERVARAERRTDRPQRRQRVRAIPRPVAGGGWSAPSVGGDLDPPTSGNAPPSAS